MTYKRFWTPINLNAKKVSEIVTVENSVKASWSSWKQEEKFAEHLKWLNISVKKEDGFIIFSQKDEVFRIGLEQINNTLPNIQIDKFLQLVDQQSQLAETTATVKKKHYPGHGWYDQNVLKYADEALDHFNRMGDQRSIDVVRAAKRQIELMAQLIDGDMSAWHQLQIEFAPNISRYENYIFPAPDNTLIDLRDIFPVQANDNVGASTLAIHYDQAKGTKYTNYWLTEPLAAVMHNLLDDGKDDLGHKVAEMCLAIDGLKKGCEHTSFCALPPLTKPGEDIDDISLQMRANISGQRINEYKAALDFGAGQRPNQSVLPGNNPENRL